MRAFSIILLGLVTMVMAADNQSFASLGAGLSSCMQPCSRDFYDDFVGSDCATDARTSTNRTDRVCGCTQLAFEGWADKNNSKEFGRCAKQHCNDESQRAKEIKGVYQNYSDMCEGLIDEAEAAGSNSATGPTVPGAKAIFASEMLALV